MVDGGFGVAPSKVSEPLAPASSHVGGPSTTDERPQTQTVFDETTFVPKRPNCTIAVNSTTQKVQRASLRFFIVAGVSLFEAFYFRSSDWKLAATCGVVAVIFGILGALVYRLNKARVLAAMALFSAETLLFVVHGWSTNLIVVAYAVFVHCALIYRLYLTYGIICDLETAEG